MRLSLNYVTICCYIYEISNVCALVYSAGFFLYVCLLFKTTFLLPVGPKGVGFSGLASHQCTCDNTAGGCTNRFRHIFCFFLLRP